MNPRDFVNFLRSRTGLILVFLVALCVALIVVNSLRDRRKTAIVAKAPTDAEVGRKPQLLQSIVREMVPFRPPQPDDKQAKERVTPAPKKAEGQAANLPPISIVAETPSNEPKRKELSEDFAPFGRLIPCELIVTVDSSSINTPIVGLITEDIYHHGRLIIPANTEVHGTAQVDRVRERIASDGRWTLVWQTGEELAITGLALDREEDGDGAGWAITDGSAGLRGRLIKRDDLAELKLFAATLISGAAEALTEKRSSPFGSFALPSLQNAPLQGAQSVLDRYSQQIQQGIERDGFYVRVPAGKQFYLYVTQTLDRAEARFGGGRLSESPALSPTSLDRTHRDPARTPAFHAFPNPPAVLSQSPTPFKP
jgi:hypothetical protein